MLTLRFIQPKDWKPSTIDYQWGYPWPDHLEGRDATEIIEQWHALWPYALDEITLRQKLLDYSGANNPRYIRYPCRLPALDDHLLEAVAEAAGPSQLKLTGTEEPEPDEGPKS